MPKTGRFARTVLTGDQNVGVRWPNALDQLEYLFHRRRLGNKFWLFVCSAGGRITERQVLCFQFLATTEGVGQHNLRSSTANSRALSQGF